LQTLSEYHSEFFFKIVQFVVEKTEKVKERRQKPFAVSPNKCWERQNPSQFN
jgi:hypothetical protein